MINGNGYFKMTLKVKGGKCPACHGKRFLQRITVLPQDYHDDLSKKGDAMMVGRAECAKEGCEGLIDFVMHPDKPDGGKLKFIPTWVGSHLLFSDFPRSKNNE